MGAIKNLLMEHGYIKACKILNQKPNLSDAFRYGVSDSELNKLRIEPPKTIVERSVEKPDDAWWDR
jgi:hypothetical protein